MNYSGYNQQQQQQQQQQQPQYSYEYDPSQIQAYDQSYAYQTYYGYNPQYAYYPDAHQTHLQFQPDSAPVHPPGVNPAAPEPAPPRPAHAPREYLAVLPQAILGPSLDKRPILE